MKHFLIIVIIFFIGCTLESPNIKLTNKTLFSFDSVHVYSNSCVPNVIKDLNANQSIKQKITFKRNDFSDGKYQIKLFKDDTIVRERTFGYFTNGASLNTFFHITIMNDTILIKSR